MTKQYVDIPNYTTYNNIADKNFSLSAAQHKNFCIKNTNVVPVSNFLSRALNDKIDNGKEPGLNSYVEMSPYKFVRTSALQERSYLLDINKESVLNIVPKSYVEYSLKKNDLLISRDGNVGEAVILEEDYPKTMICGGIYKLPVTKYKYYLLAFIKSELFKQQIDILVPKGSTYRHGKRKFLECKIPIPNKNATDTILYVELLVQAIISKEIEIHKKHKKILEKIQEELISNQKDEKYKHNYPYISDILNLDRMDSSLYSEDFKQKEHYILNYINGTSTIKDLGFSDNDISRGQNLQISNIGKSIQTDEHISGYYTLVYPKFLSKYGTIEKKVYLGNPNKLKTLKVGDIIFGAEGNEKGRSIVILEEQDNFITNIHGITLNSEDHNMQKSIFIKLMLDYYRDKGMIDSYAVGGNGGSLAIKYWDILKFPNFENDKEKEITKLYSNSEVCYDMSKCNMKTFLEQDTNFNKLAGIYEIDKSMKYLQEKLNKALDDIANDIEVETTF